MKSFLRQHTLLAVVFVLTLSLLSSLKLVSSRAQTAPQQEAKLPPWQEKIVGYKRMGSNFQRPDTSGMTERVIENQIPARLPIKVELKNLDLEPMLRHLEVKVTNTSKKPIYFLGLEIMTPEIYYDEVLPMGFDLRYGRLDLIKAEEPLQKNDVPLQPGESCVLRIPEMFLQGFEYALGKKGLTWSNLKLLYFYFSHIRFGDDTGFRGPSGNPFPSVRSDGTSTNRCKPPDGKTQASLSFPTPYSLATPFFRTSKSSTPSTRKAIR